VRGPFARRRAGTVDVTLTEPESALLRSVATQMSGVLEAPEGLAETRRLFPPAYEDDAEAQAEFAGLMSSDLLDGKRKAVTSLLETLERGAVKRGGWRVTLSGEEADDWLAAINDARLTLGTRLDVTEESYDRAISPEDPDALALEVFRYLGWLEDNLVVTLMG
jgi:predicted lipoprotein